MNLPSAARVICGVLFLASTVLPSIPALASVTGSQFVRKPDKYEPDDTAAQARPIAPGETQVHSLDIVGEVDWLRFAIAEASQVRVTAVCSRGAVRISVCGKKSGGRAIQDWTSETAPTPSIRLAEDVYYLEVRNAARSGTIPEYTISLSVEPISVPKEQQARSPEAPAALALTLYVHAGSASGSVLSGAKVTGQDGAGKAFNQSTDAGGCVKITGAPGTWQFKASKTGYKPETWSQPISETCTRHAFLQPQAPAALLLTLYVHAGSASGPVLSGAQVTGQDGAGKSFNQSTDASGCVKITGAPGTWQFKASKTGHKPVSWSQAISETVTRHAFLEPEPPAPVTLTLYVHAGSATGPLLSGVQVSSEDRAGKKLDQTTNAEGAVKITGAPGTWQFTASKTGYKPASWSQATSETVTRRAFLQPEASARVATPTFSPAPGSYTGSVTVKIDCVTAAAQIRYTTDGKVPTKTSALYSQPLVLTATTTLKAGAFKSGMTDSAVATGEYRVVPPAPVTPPARVATPTFNPAPGTYTGSVTVKIECATAGAEIRYTTDGKDPTKASALYSQPVVLTATTVVKARAFKSGMSDSAVATGEYRLVPPAPVAPPAQVATPEIVPPTRSDEYNSPLNVAMHCTTSGATIHYTNDGTDPTESSSVYKGPVTLTNGSSTAVSRTVKARALKGGMTDSAVASRIYTVRPAGGGPSRFYGAYCTEYAAWEFHRIAPSPGVNWPGDADKWYDNASSAGWEVTTDASHVVPGSIIVWVGGVEGMGHVGIVQKITADSLSIQAQNWGTSFPGAPAESAITVNFGLVTPKSLPRNNLNRGFLTFKGFILPRRVQAPPTASKSAAEIDLQLNTISADLSQRPYLYNTRGFKDSVATVWMRLSGRLTGAELQEKYDELYFASFNYASLAVTSLKTAREFLSQGNLAAAEKQLARARHFLQQSAQCYRASIELYSGHLDSAETLAQGVYTGAMTSLELGATLTLGPGASALVEGLTWSTDFAVDWAQVGLGEAEKALLVKTLTKAAFDCVPIKALGNKTISEALTRNTTRLVGSSDIYPIIHEVVKSREFEEALMRVLGKSAGYATEKLAKEAAQRTVRAILGALTAPGARPSAGPAQGKTTLTPTPRPEPLQPNRP